MKLATGKLFENVDRVLLQNFRKFHKDNPQVYFLFKRLALQVKRTGRKQYSAWAIINKIRWDFDISTRTTEEFKISNDFISLYARMLVTQHPKAFGEFFILKPMKKERKWPVVHLRAA